MAPFLVIFLLLLHGCTSSSLVAASSFKPKALVLPVSKDAATKQYVATIQQQTPLQSEKVVIHLGGQFLWVNCDSGYNSATYRHVPCGSAACSAARSGSCGSCNGTRSPSCGNNTCSAFPEDPVTRVGSTGNLLQDVLILRSTNGKTVGAPVTLPKFFFTCGGTFLLNDLAAGARGVAGLGWSAISLPNQLAATFSFPRKFAICLSSTSSPSWSGAIFFGDGPYSFLPGIDMSQSLTFTPLLINPVSTASVYSAGDPSDEYFIKVTSIRVNDKAIPVNAALFGINEFGEGGTKISTVVAYTTVETSIYRALEKAFVREAAAMNLVRVKAVKPFKTCLSTKNAEYSRIGVNVPPISLVLDKESTVWHFYGADSMVQVSDGVMCLGILDGGWSPKTSIVIGGRQLEEHLVQFDLAASQMGFSSILTSSRTSCSSFNFTSA